jgi:hypothetical protein
VPKNKSAKNRNMKDPPRLFDFCTMQFPHFAICFKRGSCLFFFSFWLLVGRNAFLEALSGIVLGFGQTDKLICLTKDAACQMILRALES